jgi:hypothetical protein
LQKYFYSGEDLLLALAKLLQKRESGLGEGTAKLSGLGFPVSE